MEVIKLNSRARTLKHDFIEKLECTFVAGDSHHDDFQGHTKYNERLHVLRTPDVYV